MIWALAFLALGADLQVVDLKGNAFSVSPAKSKATAVVFVSAICPISNAYGERMIQIYRDYSTRGVQFLFVNANSNESAAKVAEHREEAGYPFPVYMDKNNILADRLGAQMNPEALVLDPSGEVRYRGFIDDAKNPARVTNQGLRGALDAVLAGKPVATPQTKSFGCTIHRVRKK